MVDWRECLHPKVEYRPIEHEGGKVTDNWQCLECSMEFWPRRHTRMPKWLERQGSGAAPKEK